MTSMMRKISPLLFSMLLDNFYDIPEFFQLFFRAILLQFFQLFLVQELILIWEDFSLFSFDHVLKQFSHGMSVIKQPDPFLDGVVGVILLYLQFVVDGILLLELLVV